MTTLFSARISVAPRILVSACYASSKAKGKGKSKTQYNFVPSRIQNAPVAVRQVEPARSQDAPAPEVVVPAFVDASQGVPEREIYFIDEKHLPPARILYGLGLMLCLMVDLCLPHFFDAI